MTVKCPHILSPKEDDAIKKRRELGQGVAPTTTGIVLFQTRNEVNN